MQTGSSRTRVWRAAAIVIAVVALLAAAAEIALRLIIPSTVAGIVRDEFSLPESSEVAVGLGGSALLNALRGGIGEVSIDATGVPIIEGIEVEANAYADFAPFDPKSGSIEGARARLSVPGDEVGDVIALLTSGVADSGEVSDGDLTVGGRVDLFGQSVPVEVTLGFEVVDGDVRVDPRSISAAGLNLTSEEISQLSGSLLDPIVTSHTICVRDYLPAGVTLTDIVLAADGTVTIDADLNESILSDERMLETGSCA